jgi:oxygen-independent coproporphyrinogen-3 oxidase
MNAPLLRDIPEAYIMDLVERLDVRGPRYTSYPTVPVWTEFTNESRFIQALRHLGTNNQPIAAYIHIPFCKKRCLYCGCNSYITHNADRMRHYAETVITEIEHIAEHLSPNVTHGQLHLGGGTPTHLPKMLSIRLKSTRA